MSKPDWKDAPAWACKLTIGSVSGRYAWFGDSDIDGSYADNGKPACAIGCFNLVEIRPTANQHPAAACAIEWPEDDRINTVGQNGNEGLHYDPVNNPAHYDLAHGLQAIDVIKATLTPDEFRGYCIGNMLKYRLRAGRKGNAEQDLKKADWYKNALKEAYAK